MSVQIIVKFSVLVAVVTARAGNHYCESKWCPPPYPSHTACANSGVNIPTIFVKLMFESFSFARNSTIQIVCQTFGW